MDELDSRGEICSVQLLRKINGEYHVGKEENLAGRRSVKLLLCSGRGANRNNIWWKLTFELMNELVWKNCEIWKRRGWPGRSPRWLAV